MSRRITCPVCDGVGSYYDPWISDHGVDGATTTCSTCNQKGEILLSPGTEVCTNCNGSGKVTTSTSRTTCRKCDGRGFIGEQNLKRY